MLWGRHLAMRINQLTAKNYHTLENVTATFSGNYCTLSGKNNAGKSAIIGLLESLFSSRQPTLLGGEEPDFIYAADHTQWAKEGTPIEIEYRIELTAKDDPALIAAIGKLAEKSMSDDPVALVFTYSISKDDQRTLKVSVGSEEVRDDAAKEIEKRIKNANLLFQHNSTNKRNDYGWMGRRAPLYEFVLSPDEKKKLDRAEKGTLSKIRSMTRAHTQGLGQFLEKLSEKYTVEATPFERYSSRRMPIGINLRDKTVDVPLGDWGSGTQNRTQILAAILHASRINQGDSVDEKITPVVVIEEPESFLHPSAQAEFGRLLRSIANDTGIQVIVTTHSPQMLNHEEPASNLLLARQLAGRRLLGTEIVSSAGPDWMAP